MYISRDTVILTIKDGVMENLKKKEIVLFSLSKLFIEGMRRILNGSERLNVAACSTDHRDICSLAAAYRPDYLILDERGLTNSIENIASKKEIRKNVSTVLIFGDEGNSIKQESGYVIIGERTETADIVDFLTGKADLNRDINRNRPEGPNDTEELTKSESSIIELITKGMSNSDIADKLSVSDKTVKAHITNIFTKVNVKNRYQLIIYGKRNREKLSASK